MSKPLDFEKIVRDEFAKQKRAAHVNLVMLDGPPRVVELLFVPAYRGIGTLEDPCRIVRQLWTKEGELVAEEAEREVS